MDTSDTRPTGYQPGNGEQAVARELDVQLASVDPRARACIEDWAKKLVDLSRRNRLLHYRPTKRTTLTFREPTPARVLEVLSSGKAWRFYMPAPIQVQTPGQPTPPVSSLDEVLRQMPPKDQDLVTTERNPIEIERSLQAINRKARAEFEDRGTHVLHLAWGLVKWHDAKSNEDSYAPLVLTPVTLQRHSIRDLWELTPAVEDDPVFNPPLRVKLGVEYGIDIPQFDPAETDPAEILRILKGHFPREWEIQDHSSLGIFSFAKEAMYRDLVDNAAVVAAHPMIQSLIAGRLVAGMGQSVPPAKTDIDAVDRPGTGFSVIDADSSQRVAIEAARRGVSFVLHGPPGTGKSQTIANVIADFIGRGKSVLFVSQKMAALEVVANRLQEVELRDLVLELHSAKASRSEVVQSLLGALDARITAKPQSAESAAQRVTAAQTKLDTYVAALHEIRMPYGRTAHDVLGEASSLSSAPALAGPALDSRAVTASHLETMESCARRLSDAWMPVEEAERFPWHGVRAPGSSEAERQVVAECLVGARTAITSVDAIDGRLRVALEVAAERTQAGRAATIDLGRAVLGRISAPLEWLTSDEDIDAVKEMLAKWAETSGIWAGFVERLRGAYGDEWESVRPELASELEDLQAGLTKTLGRDPDWDQFLASQQAIVSTIERARAAILALRAPADGLSTSLGLPKTSAAPISALDLCTLAGRASQQRHRPPREWLSQARLGDAEAFLATWGPGYQQQAELSARLGALYQPGILQVELGPLIARMRMWAGHWWNRARPQHRADLRLIASLTRAGRLLPTVMSDLEAAAALQELRVRLASADREAAQVLGPYAKGLQTDVSAADAAVGAAKTLLRLPPSTDWTRLAQVATFEAAYDPSIERLVAALELALGDLKSSLQGLLAWADPGIGAELRTSRPLDGIGDWLEAMKSGCDRWSGLLGGLAARRKTPPDRACLDLVADALARKAIDALDAVLAEEEPYLKGKIRDFYRGFATEWGALIAGANWASTVRKWYPVSLVPERVARRILDGSFDDLPWGELESGSGVADQRAASVGALFEQTRAGEVAAVLAGPTPEAQRLLDDLLMRIDDLGAWHDFARARQELIDRGWVGFVDQAVARRIDRGSICASMRRAWLEDWLEDEIRSDPRLSGFTREEHERAVGGFRIADLELVQAGRERVLSAYEAAKPKAITIAGGEQAIIRREAAKKRRHLPVRQVLAGLPTTLPRIKPCLMMSPLSVSHFLSPDVRFDVVIFDEASQVPPEDAVNCIYRGTQLIVAGDPKQLPPTDFFQLAAAGDASDDDGADFEDQLGDFESILDVCQGSGLVSLPLEWHYRSRDDALIAFSNRYIYGDSLITFPAPFQHSTDLGVHFVHVPDGVFERGRTASNPIEARKVVDVVCDQVHAHPGLTLGVVAFSVAQQNAIQDELDRRLLADPGLEQFLGQGRLNGFFVKNLETVQGDERDVIIFSIGYGRDETGKLYHNFGPLNRKGGARRLNVAATRARRKVVVVSSMTAKELKLADVSGVAGTLPDGANLLRAYLDYAERGVLQGGRTQSDREELEPLEADVASVVRQLGYEVVERVGASAYRVDIGVMSRAHPGRIALGVECDGSMYLTASTTRDRDRLRQSVLRGLGWQLMRVWAQDWQAHRPVAVDRLRAAIDEAEREPTRGVAAASSSALSSQPSAPTAPPRQIESRSVTDSMDLSGSQFAWTRPYVVAAIKQYRTGLEFHDYGLRQEHAARIAALVNAEGPLHQTYLTARLSRAFGLHRSGARVVDAVTWGVRSAVASGLVRVQGPFVWPAASTQFVFVRVPREGAPDTIRPIEQIPPEEIDLCILRHLVDAGSLEESRLRSNVARILGFDRTGGHIGEAIDALLTGRKRDGVILELANGCLSLNPRYQLPPLPEVAAIQPAPPTATAPRQSVPASPPASPRPGATPSRGATPATMPGADALPLPYGPGDTVSHPRLGVGVVRSVQGPIVEVAFAGMTRTVIDTRIVPMTKLASGQRG